MASAIVGACKLLCYKNSLEMVIVYNAASFEAVMHSAVVFQWCDGVRCERRKSFVVVVLIPVEDLHGIASPSIRVKCQGLSPCRPQAIVDDSGAFCFGLTVVVPCCYRDVWVAQTTLGMVPIVKIATTDNLKCQCGFSDVTVDSAPVIRATTPIQIIPTSRDACTTMLAVTPELALSSDPTIRAGTHTS